MLNIQLKGLIMTNLKSKLKNKDLTLGSWLSIPNNIVCEMMCKDGFDWLVIDMEHTSITESDMLSMIQIISLSGIAPLVRVGANDPLLIKKAMDCGAHGVVVPMVSTPEDAKKAVESAFYPPKGERGVGLFRAQGYGSGFAEYLDKNEEQTVIIVQIEHISAVENIDEILAVDGVDGFIVGPYDLSASLGVPGEFDHPDVCKALSTLQDVMKNGAKSGGYHIVHSDQAQLQQRVNEGAKFIAYGDDMVFLSEKLGEAASHISDLKTKND